MSSKLMKVPDEVTCLVQLSFGENYEKELYIPCEELSTLPCVVFDDSSENMVLQAFDVEDYISRDECYVVPTRYCQKCHHKKNAYAHKEYGTFYICASCDGQQYFSSEHKIEPICGITKGLSANDFFLNKVYNELKNNHESLKGGV